MAVRAALGADRSRLIRMMLVESSVLAAIGGIAGLGLGWGTSRALVIATPIELPRATEISFDGRVVLFTLMVTVHVRAAVRHRARVGNRHIEAPARRSKKAAAGQARRASVSDAFLDRSSSRSSPAPSC